MLKNVEKCWKVLKIVEKRWKLLKRVEKRWKMLKNLRNVESVEKCWKMLKRHATQNVNRSGAGKPSRFFSSKFPTHWFERGLDAEGDMWGGSFYVLLCANQTFAPPNGAWPKRLFWGSWDLRLLPLHNHTCERVSFFSAMCHSWDNSYCHATFQLGCRNWSAVIAHIRFFFESHAFFGCIFTKDCRTTWSLPLLSAAVADDRFFLA